MAEIGEHDWYAIMTDAVNRNARGRHSLDSDGKPFATVYGDGDETTLSHELLEMLADAWGNLQILHRNDWDRNSGQLYKREIADAVEGTSYLIDGVRVSDFLLPNYFIAGSHGPWDYCGVLDGPLSNSATGNAPMLSVEGVG